MCPVQINRNSNPIHCKPSYHALMNSHGNQNVVIESFPVFWLIFNVNIGKQPRNTWPEFECALYYLKKSLQNSLKYLISNCADIISPDRLGIVLAPIRNLGEVNLAQLVCLKAYPSIASTRQLCKLIYSSINALLLCRKGVWKWVRTHKYEASESKHRWTHQWTTVP